MMKKKPLVILSGATAVGKTGLSLDLARRIGGSIISADSMQVYRGMDIGTAKILPSEMQGIEHYLIDELDPEEEFNVYEFQKRANRYIDEILSREKIPILVGGTGFYIQAVLYAVEFSEEPADRSYREELERIGAEQGAEHLHQMLQQIDPEAARQIHVNNQKRVIRALEFYHDTGTQISRHNEEQRSRDSQYNYAYFVLNRDRSVIYERINQRVDQMVQQGLVEEVRGLLDKGVSPDCVSIQGLGYKEIVRYLKGELTLEEACAFLKQSTRHFAKRQLTWFRRERDVIWMNYEDYESIGQMSDAMIEILKEKHIVPVSGS